MITTFAKVKVTPKPFNFDLNLSPDRIHKNMRALFNNQTNSDFRFKFEDKFIYAHFLQ